MILEHVRLSDNLEEQHACHRQHAELCPEAAAHTTLVECRVFRNAYVVSLGFHFVAGRSSFCCGTAVSNGSYTDQVDTGSDCELSTQCQYGIDREVPSLSH